MVEYPQRWSEIEVGLAHDWLTGMRGGERVLELLCSGFRSADIYTLLCNPSAISETIKSHRVHTSRLQKLPRVERYYRYLLPFMPSAIEGMRPRAADLVISTSHCVAKGLIPPADARHICYCFTPMRYAWTFYSEYFGENPLKKAVLGPMLARMREWDRRASERVDRFVAISEHVRERIERHYGRGADVVYPPVDLDYYTPGDAAAAADFDLIVSALVPYKRIDLAVRAYTRSGEPLKIVGVGTEMEPLARIAGDNIEFLGWQSYDDIRALYRNCRLLVFPGEEDFGLVPVEVQACGRPVVAYRRGGALETVREGASGVFFDEQDEESLIDAVQQAAHTEWDPAPIRASAERFGIDQFIRGLDEAIGDLLDL